MNKLLIGIIVLFAFIGGFKLSEQINNDHGQTASAKPVIVKSSAEYCKTVLKIDKMVFDNVIENTMTGDSDKIMRGIDSWYEENRTKCLEYLNN